MPSYRNNLIAKQRKTNIFQYFWKKRFRVYAILAILVLPPLFYASGSNISNHIQTIGYNVIDQNILAQKVQKQEVSAPTISSAVSSSVSSIIKYDLAGLNLQKILSERGIKAGYISAESIINRGFKLPVESKIVEGIKEKINEAKKQLPKSLDEIYTKDNVSNQKSYFRMGYNYNINAPIVYASFEDLFQTKDGNIDFNTTNDTSETDSPLQKKLQGGIVHLAFTPLPGEIGNSYIVGHSSNYAFIISDYNQVFKPLERNGQIGEDFTIFDLYGRELKFKTFDTALIEEVDTAQAYKDYGASRRIVTLQTSVVSYRPEKGYWPYQRWLVRGELICPNGEICKD